MTDNDVFEARSASGTPVRLDEAAERGYCERLAARLRQDHPNESQYVTTLVEEAEFGFSVVRDKIAALKQASPPARILEVGAGAFILSTWLAHEGFKVTALEPLGVGFGALKRIQDSVLEFARLNNVEFTISTDFVEDHAPSEKYDFAFAINVFEHIDKLDAAFASVRRLVKAGGAVRVACPNYEVPYESHYSIPIIWNGALTKKLFHKHIARFDESHDCQGLWESLNFITSTEVLRRARAAQLGLTFDRAILRQMFARFDRASALTRRHAAITGFARLINILRLPRLLQALPMRLHPYMVFDLQPGAVAALDIAA